MQVIDDNTALQRQTVRASGICSVAPDPKTGGVRARRGVSAVIKIQIPYLQLRYPGCSEVQDQPSNLLLSIAQLLLKVGRPRNWIIVPPSHGKL